MQDMRIDGGGIVGGMQDGAGGGARPERGAGTAAPACAEGDSGPATGATHGVPAPAKVCKFLRWTKDMEGLFLDHLSATGNVTAAAQAIGVSRHNVHYRHRTNAAFAAGWASALNAGYRNVEARMIQFLLSEEPFDYDKALRMITQRASYLKADTPRGGPARQIATPEETDAAILKNLDRFAAQEARKRTAKGKTDRRGRSATDTRA